MPLTIESPPKEGENPAYDQLFQELISCPDCFHSVWSPDPVCNSLETFGKKRGYETSSRNGSYKRNGVDGLCMEVTFSVFTGQIFTRKDGIFPTREVFKITVIYSTMFKGGVSFAYFIGDDEEQARLVEDEEGLWSLFRAIIPHLEEGLPKAN